MSFRMDDYVDVAERIRKFYEKFPDGRLTRLGDPKLMEVGSKLFVVYTAMAYRTVDDPVPAIGTAWEPFPGPTQFTRDSELMNAETAAWGRAIIAAGIGSKKIASQEEVRARQPDPVVERDVQRVEHSDVTVQDPWVDGIKARASVFRGELREAITGLGGTVPENVSSWGRVLATLDPATRRAFELWLTSREEAAADVPWPSIAEVTAEPQLTINDAEPS